MGDPEVLYWINVVYSRIDKFSGEVGWRGLAGQIRIIKEVRIQCEKSGKYKIKVLIGLIVSWIRLNYVRGEYSYDESSDVITYGIQFKGDITLTAQALQAKYNYRRQPSSIR